MDETHALVEKMVNIEVEENQIYVVVYMEDVPFLDVVLD